MRTPLQKKLISPLSTRWRRTGFLSNKNQGKQRMAVLAIAVLLASGIYVFAFKAPESFVPGTVVQIEQGLTIEEIAAQMDREKVVQSSRLFDLLIRILNSDGGAVAGSYYFPRSQSVFAVAWRVAYGNFGIDPVRIVIPEGTSVRGIANILSKEIPGFDGESFYNIAKDKEGYLFPDTYFILPTASPRSIVTLMEENFERKVAEIRSVLYESEHSLHELVILASLLEKEANDLETRRQIAGVLWNRLEQDMLLQVDAAFLYINGKNTYELTQNDLATDSPYNTYKHKGLPPGPITNPSVESILAAATPAENEFLFYLADRNGTTYFSKTFAEHTQKKQLHIQ